MVNKPALHPTQLQMPRPVRAINWYYQRQFAKMTGSYENNGDYSHLIFIDTQQFDYSAVSILTPPSLLTAE